MSAAEVNNEEVCARFSRIYWHDSKLIDIHILKRVGTRLYDLRLDLDLIISSGEGKVERKRRSAVFRDCRIVQANLDLLGVALCSGDIAVADCYLDAVELEKERRTTRDRFDLPDSDNSLTDCFGFVIRMVPPGGELLIFSREFELL